VYTKDGVNARTTELSEECLTVYGVTVTMGGHIAVVVEDFPENFKVIVPKGTELCWKQN